MVVNERDQTVRIFTDNKKWSLIRELSLRDGTNLNIEDRKSRVPAQDFQLKAAELIENIRKGG